MDRKIKKMKFHVPLLLIFTLTIEVILLILIVLVVLVGVLGIFLPILPGLFIFGLAAAIYSLLTKSGSGKITPHIHYRLISFKNKAHQLKITQKIMGLIKNYKKRKNEKVKEEILKHGLILGGFNVALVLMFLFGFITLSLLADVIQINVMLMAFVPLLVIFLFAGVSSLVWYRFGQILGGHFKKKKVINSVFVVLISVLPLLVILLLFSGIFSLAGGFVNELLVIAFIGFLLMTILAAVFELLVVSLGVITKVK